MPTPSDDAYVGLQVALADWRHALHDEIRRAVNYIDHHDYNAARSVLMSILNTLDRAR